MQNSKKINIFLIFLFSSVFIVIPNLLISIQRDIEFSIEEKNPSASGDYAYMAGHISSLAVIGISEAIDLGIPVYEDTTGLARDVYVSGDYAYVADATSGLAVIDISDPTNPGTPVYEDTLGMAFGVYVSGDYAYVAGVSTGLAVIDVSDPTNPGTPVYEDTTGDALSVYVSGDYAYVADYDSGLAIIEISIPNAIPFGNLFLIFMGLSVIFLIVYKKRKIILKS
jgi:hypothetical protein